MEHILDNPIWNALITGNKDIAQGDERAKCVPRTMGAFAGLADYLESNFESLYKLSPVGAPVVLFTSGEISIPKQWKPVVAKTLLQMVYQQPHPPTAQAYALVPLQEKDIPAMIALTAQTNPGPFLSRTIDYGNYNGFFDGDRLVAMVGERLKPSPYTEISAVCTHPNYVGKGYASQLLLNQIRKIMAGYHIPFLHVLPDNTSACNLYQKLGFQTRKEMMVYVLEKKEL